MRTYMIRWLLVISVAITGFVISLSAPAQVQEWIWKQVAKENEFFTVPAYTTVRYGVDTRWVEKVMTVSSGACTNSFFSADPAPNALKVCELKYDAPALEPIPVPNCWPSQVLGSGTSAKTAIIMPADAARATPGATAPSDAEPVHVVWWYCAAPLEPTGWKASVLLCAQSKLVSCLTRVPALNSTSLATAWKADPPVPANIAGIGWAVLAWRTLYRDPGMPAPQVVPQELWVVGPAPSNANPPGTRPAYILTPPSTLTDLYVTDRVKSGDPCDCNKASLLRSTTRYCQTGDRPDKVAVCVKK